MKLDLTNKMTKIIMILLLALLTPDSARSFIAYDCGAPATNFTTLSLVNIKDCDIPIVEPKVTPVNIQLIQTVEYNLVKVIQCKVKISRSVYHCGSFSHVSTVSNPHMEYLQDMTRTNCQDIHRTNTHYMYNTVIRDIPLNGQLTRDVEFAGTADKNGNCEGDKYSDFYGSYSNVVVQGQVDISINSYEAPVNYRKNEVSLRSGIKCIYLSGWCVDSEEGWTYWDIIKRDSCETDRSKVIYQGPAQNIKDSSGNATDEFYAVTTSQITFALSKKDILPVCGHSFIQTEHPRLFIVESTDNTFLLKKTDLTPTDMDIFAYVNSKVVYLEKSIKREIVSMYNNAIKQQCELEKTVLRNSLALATIAPAEFAFQFVKQPGYMASVTGEVIRISKCVPVEVKTRRTEECYLELPVKLDNGSFFMLPRTHLLVKRGNQIDCSTLTPSMYKINNAWYQVLPKIVPATDPEEIGPNTKASWKYTTPQHLATSGLYSSEDLNKLRDSMMFPVERNAVLNIIARGASGKQIISQGISMDKFIDEIDIGNKIMNHFWKVHSWIGTFGSYTSAFFGSYLIWKGLKFIADTAVHAIALHSIFGCSIWLLSAIWSSLTNYAIHKKHKYERERQRENESPECITLISAGARKPEKEKVIKSSKGCKVNSGKSTKNMKIEQADERKKAPRDMFP